MWPNKSGTSIVLDLGASIDCSEKNLIDIIQLLTIYIAASFRVLPSASRIVSSLQHMKLSYPAVNLLYNELKNSGRVVITENWGNFNSVLAMTTSIFDKTPLPYVPDTCSEWELKRDIILYNLKSYVNFKTRNNSLLIKFLYHDFPVCMFLI